MADPAQAQQPAEQTDTPDLSTSEPDEQLKDRFRAALERKRRADTAQSGRGHGGGDNKVHEAGRAGGKRTFRRKSG